MGIKKIMKEGIFLFVFLSLGNSDSQQGRSGSKVDSVRTLINQDKSSTRSKGVLNSVFFCSRRLKMMTCPNVFALTDLV